MLLRLILRGDYFLPSVNNRFVVYQLPLFKRVSVLEKKKIFFFVILGLGCVCFLFWL